MRPIGSLDDFARGVGPGESEAPAERIVFGLDSAPPPLRSLQVQFARLELVIGGVYRNALCTADAKIVTRDLVAGDALFIPANCWNEPLWDRDVHLLSLLFGATHMGVSLVTWQVAAGAFTSVEKRSCLVPGNGPLAHLIEALTNLREEESTTAPHARLLVHSIVEYAKTLILNPMPDEERQSSALFRAACLYIDENYDKTITREIVARQLGISPNYFSRVFSEQGGMTFSDHLNAVRIGKARMMLEKYDLSLAQIARRCGFHDFNYFLKVFKKRVGRTPTEYRASVTGGA
jgi:AraC-like DNA-binding protein